MTNHMHPISRWLDRHQVWLYLAGIVVGAILGRTFTAAAPLSETLIYPALGLVLYVTFLGIPISNLKVAVTARRFLITTLLLNFLIVPLVVFGVSRLVAHDDVLLLGVVIVLLTPCIDYVIVFTQLAGGDAKSLLAASPVLMFAQMLLLPMYLWLFLGDQLSDLVTFAPFIEAFFWIILVPLIGAGATQLATKRWRWAISVESSGATLMVPLMVLTLIIVVASQISAVHQRVADLLLTVPVYIIFAAVMVIIGLFVARQNQLNVPQQRAVVFSGVTRNSLVVLPIVLALPARYDLASLIVVTQTLVELCIMVACVRIIPRLIPVRSAAG